MPNLKNVGTRFFKLFGGNDPSLTIAILCAANAVIKPMITLSNPNETKERKTFAAMTECATELTALPFCIFIPKLFKKFLAPIFFNEVVIKGKALTPKQTAIINFSSFLGIVAANFIIPKVALHFVNLVKKHQKPDSSQTNEIKSNDVLKKIPALDIVSKAPENPAFKATNMNLIKKQPLLYTSSPAVSGMKVNG